MKIVEMSTTSHGTVWINLEQISWMKKDGNYTLIYMSNGTMLTTEIEPYMIK